jgi:hypothetical protein
MPVLRSAVDSVQQERSTSKVMRLCVRTHTRGIHLMAVAASNVPASGRNLRPARLQALCELSPAAMPQAEVDQPAGMLRKQALSRAHPSSRGGSAT